MRWDTQAANTVPSNRGARGSVAAVGAGLFNGGAAIAGVRSLRASSVCIVGGLVDVAGRSRRGCHQQRCEYGNAFGVCILNEA